MARFHTLNICNSGGFFSSGKLLNFIKELVRDEASQLQELRRQRV